MSLQSPPELPSGFIRTSDVLHERLTPARARHLDLQYGNEELLYGLDVLGLAGPFYRTSPWELEDEQGVRRINACGYAALPFGEMPPAITSFMQEFLEHNRAMTLPQQSSSPWRAALQTNLVKLLSRELPSHSDSQVFFCSSGTEAIEGAMKFAKAWRPEARHFISFGSGYHGKTYGSLSLTPNPEYQDVFRPLVPGALTSPYGDLDALKALVRRAGPDKIIAVVVEPIQGEGGVNIPPPGFLRGLGSSAARTASWSLPTRFRLAWGAPATGSSRRRRGSTPTSLPSPNRSAAGWCRWARPSSGSPSTRKCSAA